MPNTTKYECLICGEEFEVGDNEVRCPACTSTECEAISTGTDPKDEDEG